MGDRFDDLVRDHTDLAIAIARRFGRGPVPDPDLEQVAMLGLVAAARRFDPTRGAFAAYASVTILGELKKFRRDTSWVARVPRRLQEHALLVRQMRDRLEQETGRSPTVGEIADAAALTSEEVVEAQACLASGAEPLDERADAPDPSIVPSIDVRTALERLDPLERTVVVSCVVLGYSQRDVARRLGISQPQVHRRLRHALDDLARELADGVATG